MRKIVAVLSALLFAQSAAAADWIVGLGATDFNAQIAKNDLSATLEVHGVPRWHLGRIDLGWGAGAVANFDGDLWAGGGVSAVMPIGRAGWFAEASVMPGLYVSSSALSDLGSAFEIRSLIGIGHKLGDGGTRLSVAVTHTSNAGIGRRNPGANALAIRLRRAF